MDNNYNGSRWQENKDKLVLSKENRPQLNSRRLALIYNSFESDYKSSSYCYSIFLLIFRSPFSVYSFSFILSSLFHLYPPRVDQVFGVNPFPNSFLCFHYSLTFFCVRLRLRLRLSVSVSVHLLTNKSMIYYYYYQVFFLFCYLLYKL